MSLFPQGNDPFNIFCKEGESFSSWDGFQNTTTQTKRNSSQQSWSPSTSGLGPPNTGSSFSSFQIPNYQQHNHTVSTPNMLSHQNQSYTHGNCFYDLNISKSNSMNGIHHPHMHNTPVTAILPSSSAQRILTDNKYKISYISGGKDFESRVLCYFTESGVIPFYCNVCRRESYIKISKNNTITTSCNHFVSCNECRGRSVRRILRCKECSEEIAGIFPVCFEGKCIDLQDKEPVNTGACPLCERKLRKEQCDYDCRRRKTPEYSTARKKFNGVIIELVQNPDGIQKSGVWRPCPHFSFCPLHNVICRGHGKYSACSECKEQQKQQSKSYNLDRE